ncbi:hypothetical protein O9929_07640 [Vibrio lentus]|nr:hypothetical protein [Vibrio lentus]
MKVETLLFVVDAMTGQDAISGAFITLPHHCPLNKWLLMRVVVLHCVAIAYPQDKPVLMIIGEGGALGPFHPRSCYFSITAAYCLFVEPTEKR